MTKRAVWGLMAAATVALSGCGGGASTASASGTPSAGSSSSATLSGTVTVFAAASLTGVFTDLGKRMEQAHPGLHVRFDFAGSWVLATQIAQGAPADVFASADEKQMKVVTTAGDEASAPQDFAKNVLEIAVPPTNPGRVTGIADFAKANLTLAVCAPQVPCGAAARQVFAAAHVDAKPDTQEQDVKAALTKVALGEVDAALVYETDVKAAGATVRGIEFPEAQDAVNTYPICVLKAAPNAAAAKAFVDLVRSPTGQQALKAAGFRAS